ncbi:MAG: hypothetical protein ACOVOI_18520, partial [Hyphomicrobiales bacterium]
MDDLRIPHHDVLEAIIVAMHEDERPTLLARFLQSFVKAGPRLVEIDAIGANRDEVPCRIGGQALRPLHLAHLADAVGRD